MIIQLFAIFNCTMGLEDEKVIVNDEAAAETYYNELLDQLGYDGDEEDFEEVSDFLGELADENLILEEFDLPVWLSVETVETLQALEGWARTYSPPDFTRLVKAIEEVKAAL